jgi:hypothetical protein
MAQFLEVVHGRIAPHRAIVAIALLSYISPPRPSRPNPGMAPMAAVVVPLVSSPVIDCLLSNVPGRGNATSPASSKDAGLWPAWFHPDSVVP